ncbi:MAG: hypothetical protein ACQEVT_01180 [Pseudomonadota bacterium]
MARARDKITGVAAFDTRYDEPDAIDWGEVQKIVPTKIDADVRKEVTGCAIEFAAAFAMQAQGADKSVLAMVSKKLEKLASDAVSLNTKVSGEDKKYSDAFTVLSLAYSYDDHLRSALNDMSTAGQRLLDCLQNAPAVSLEKSAVEPLTAGCSAFIAEVLKGATAKSARGNHAWLENKGYEFERWGVNVGPQSRKFLKFSQVVLGEDLTPSRLEVAFENMRTLLSPKHPHFSKLHKE